MRVKHPKRAPSPSPPRSGGWGEVGVRGTGGEALPFVPKILFDQPFKIQELTLALNRTHTRHCLEIISHTNTSPTVSVPLPIIPALCWRIPLGRWDNAEKTGNPGENFQCAAHCRESRKGASNCRLISARNSSVPWYRDATAAVKDRVPGPFPQLVPHT